MITNIVCTDVKGGIAKKDEIPWKCEMDRKNLLAYIKVADAILCTGNIYRKMKPLLAGKKCYVYSRIFCEDLNVTTFQDLGFISLIPPGFILNCGGPILYEYVAGRLMYQFSNMRIEDNFQCDAFYPVKYVGENKLKMNLVVNDEITECVYNRSYSKSQEECGYLSLLSDVLWFGKLREYRNAPAWSLYSQHINFDLEEEFPLLTTRLISFKIVFEELMFFLRGRTQTKELEAKGITIWVGNTNRAELNKRGEKDPIFLEYEEGEMGPMYV